MPEFQYPANGDPDFPRLRQAAPRWCRLESALDETRHHLRIRAGDQTPDARLKLAGSAITGSRAFGKQDEYGWRIDQAMPEVQHFVSTGAFPPDRQRIDKKRAKSGHSMVLEKHILGGDRENRIPPCEWQRGHQRERIKMAGMIGRQYEWRCCRKVRQAVDFQPVPQPEIAARQPPPGPARKAGRQAGLALITSEPGHALEPDVAGRFEFPWIHDQGPVKMRSSWPSPKGPSTSE